MTPEQRAIPCCKIVDGDVCAVCRKPVSGDGFWHTCGWLFCSEKCSKTGSDDAVSHNRRIVAAIQEAVLAEREACARVADKVRDNCAKSKNLGMLMGSTAAAGIANNIRARSKTDVTTSDFKIN